MATAGDIVANLRLKVDDFRTGMQNAKRQTDEFQTNFESKAGQFKKVGAGMTAGGVAIGVGLGGAVKKAANFEAGMSRVGAVSGATEKEMNMMTEEAKRLGSQTAFSATEASEGFQYLSMAGFDAEESVASMGDVLNMASAGQVELGDAANIASNVLSGFGMEADDAGRASDVLLTFLRQRSLLRILTFTD